MSRGIRFRAWNVPDEKMYTGLPYSKAKGNDDFNDVLKHPTIYKVMQWTGLKDKNGKYIYEGDIVRITWANSKNQKDYKVFYFEEGAFFQLENIRCNYDVDTFCGYSNEQIEVIGNIYENQE